MQQCFRVIVKSVDVDIWYQTNCIWGQTLSALLLNSDGWMVGVATEGEEGAL